MISIPLQITPKGFLRDDTVEASIGHSIELLMQTPMYGCKADPHYGFVFKNLRFETFNESEGTVSDGLASNTVQMQAKKNTGDKDIYKMKVSGTSRNINTFAAELKKAITTYEPRLGSVSVSLSYVREEKTIYVSVKGKIVESRAPYKYETTIKIWR